MPPVPGYSWQTWRDRLGIVWGELQALLNGNLVNQANYVNAIAGAIDGLA